MLGSRAFKCMCLQIPAIPTIIVMNTYMFLTYAYTRCHTLRAAQSYLGHVLNWLNERKPISTISFK